MSSDWEPDQFIRALPGYLWILVIGCGVTAAPVFVYLGNRLKRPSCYVAAAIYAFGIVAWIFMLTVLGDNRATESATPAEAFGQLVFIATWAASVVHGFIIRDAWRRNQATVEAYLPTAAPGGSPMPPQGWTPPEPSTPVPPPPPLPPTGQATFDFPQQVPPPWDGNPIPVPTTPQQPSSVVDVNTATAEELRNVLGLSDAEAQRVVATRSHLGRYDRVEQLLEAARLEPHVFVRVRSQVTTGPPSPPDPTRGRGRRLEF